MDQASPHQALRDKLKQFRFGMLTAFDDDLGILRSRPLTQQEVAADGSLWFFISDASATFHEAEDEREVNISYADEDKQLYVSVSGRAVAVRDPAKARELWKPIYKSFFPQGLDDPHMVLLKVEVSDAEYWDSPGGTVTQLYRMAKALVTGQPPYREGEHRKMSNL